MSDDLYHKKITEGLKRLAGRFGPEAIIPVNVVSVDTLAFTCECETDDEIVIPGVLYKTVEGGAVDIVFQPAANSRIYIGRVSDSDQWVMIKPGAVDLVQFKCGDTEFKMDATGISLNGGENGGMPKTAGLKGQMNKVEDELINFKKLLLQWTPVPNDGGASLKLLIGNWAASTVKKSQAVDFENNKVKQ